MFDIYTAQDLAVAVASKMLGGYQTYIAGNPAGYCLFVYCNMVSGYSHMHSITVKMYT